MRKYVVIAAVAGTCLLLALLAIFALPTLSVRPTIVGFIYDNDEDTPYSHNFSLAQEAIEREFSDRVKVMAYTNVLEEALDAPVDELAANGASIVFTNNYGNMREQAAKYPSIEFCQVSNDPYPDDEALPNYHTFKGEIYQGRYASGVVAGIKLKDLLDRGKIGSSQAKVGFVAAFPYAEVISGYTAFLLGVRSVVPEATMEVRYTHAWENYVLEKDCATLLLDNGCQILSQHTDTVGPAVACEEYYAREVYHVGYNQSMTDVAPNASLVSTRICWDPYIVDAVRARLEDKPIEDVVQGNVHSKNDMSAGFNKGWVELDGLNERLLPDGAAKTVDETIAQLNADASIVYVGDYVGVSPTDPKDTCDLTEGFRENENSSIPAFHYVLRDVITIAGDAGGEQT